MHFKSVEAQCPPVDVVVRRVDSISGDVIVIDQGSKVPDPSPIAIELLYMLLWQGGTQNSCKAASPLVRLVVEEWRWETSDHPQSSPSKLGWHRAKSYCPLLGAQGYGQRQAYI
ncbi:hypothetical protein TNCV_1419011 [Trichonephila clavipes]|nr:hypothetical protein TNCV_1419011 [Trichonephila clavipes]